LIVAKNGEGALPKRWGGEGVRAQDHLIAERRRREEGSSENGGKRKVEWEETEDKDGKKKKRKEKGETHGEGKVV